MLHLKKRLSKSGLTAATVMLFYHAAVLLLLGRCCRGEIQVVGPFQPVSVTIGEDIVLPCQLKPAQDAVGMTIEWARLDLKPRFVHVWHKRKDLLINQHPSYKGRTSVSINKLSHGDISLALSKGKLSDNGIYRCYLPDVEKYSTVQLVVGTASSLAISLAGVDRSSSGVVLQCESKGWYPQPEVFWLDGEGNQLPAGPTETVRGPDGLYTVSSRVTVEKTHSNSFTCRVHQKNINQTRETEIHVPDDFFMATSSCAACISISVVACLTCVLAVVLAVWKWRRNKIKTTVTLQRENEKLMAENDEVCQLMLISYKEQHRAMADIHMKHEAQLSEQKKKLKELLEENMNELQSVGEDIKTMVENKPDYLELNEIITKQKVVLNDTQQALEKMQVDTDKLLTKAEDVTARLNENQNEAENHVDEQ